MYCTMLNYAVASAIFCAVGARLTSVPVVSYLFSLLTLLDSQTL